MNSKFLEDFDHIKRIEFEESCFCKPRERHVVEFDGNDCIFYIEHFLDSPSCMFPVKDYKSTFMKWLAECKIENWKRSYVDPTVLDGTQWELTIHYDNKKRVRNYEGSNDYPTTYEKLAEIMGYRGKDYDED